MVEWGWQCKMAKKINPIVNGNCETKTKKLESNFLGSTHNTLSTLFIKLVQKYLLSHFLQLMNITRLAFNIPILIMVYKNHQFE